MLPFPRRPRSPPPSDRRDRHYRAGRRTSNRRNRSSARHAHIRQRCSRHRSGSASRRFILLDRTRRHAPSAVHANYARAAAYRADRHRPECRRAHHHPRGETSVSATHFWFRSGAYSLLAHLDTVADRAPLGLVIVPPFGWEEVCAYRPLRFMAQRFAELGIPTLRYDLPAAGDSSGDPQDPGLFDSWVQSVGDAVETLRAATAVDDVAVLGVHLGAMLAMAASARGANIRQLVLWGPAARGRALIRELHAAANVERWECLPEEDAPRPPMAGFGASGF